MDEEQLLNAEIEDHHVEEKKVEEAKQVKLIGIVILATGLLWASSFASIFNSYGDVSPFIKNIWRWQMVLAFLIWYWLIVGWGNDKEKKFAKTFNGNCYLFISGVAVTCCQVSFMTCAWYTISSHAYILGSLSGVIIIIVKVVLKLETHFLERVGTIAVIIGAVFLMFDKDATKIDLEEETLLGDLIAILSSIFLAAYIT